MRIVVIVAFIALLAFGSEVVLSGSVQSEDQKNITSRNMGYVMAVNFKEGDSVKKGDILYVIDSKEIDAQKLQVSLQIQQAELQKNMYQSQLDNVTLNYKRHKRLYEKDMIAKYELENLELHKKNLEDMVSISQKQINQARAQLKVINNQYNYLKVKAPNDGVVVAKNIKVGEMAMPGMPAMVISSSNNLRVVADLGESEVSKLKVGDSAKIFIDAIGFQGNGEVVSIVPTANPMTHSFKLKVAFEPKDMKVYPGMYAKLIVEGSEDE
ncbi:MAG: efflux RND transporter periplasmic adaptor subunit [Campylobacterales bacterium]